MNHNMIVNKSQQLIQFIIMTLVGISFNPMNILAFRFSDLYLSATLVYGGFLMAANMIWAHEFIHYFSMGHFNKYMFGFGVVLTIAFSVLLLRNQFMVDDNQWLRRMISHHSTALTTSHKIHNKTTNPTIKKLARDIIETQEREIILMKSLVK